MAGKKRPPVSEEPAVADEDEAFPRGGRDDLTPLEKRQLSQQAEKDFHREQQTDDDGKKQKKKAKRYGEQDDAEGAFFSKSAAAGKVQHVEQLKYKNLAAGMKLWGCVLEVAPEGLTVSLPHGLRGTVAPEEASDVLSLMLDSSSKRGAALRAAMPRGTPPSLPQLFSVGQFVRCVVAGLSSTAGGEADEAAAAADAGAGGSRKARPASKRIALSLRLKALAGSSSSSKGGSSSSSSGLGPEALLPGQVLPAVVRSVEDRGYSLTFGIKGVTGFLPAKDYATYYGADSPLLPGSLLDVAVAAAAAAAAGGSSSSSGVVQVSVAHDAVSGGQLQQWEGLNMGSLMPGALVSCKVRQVCPDGVLVSFCGFFHGAIDHCHLGSPVPEDNWQARYKPGQRLQARLLYVDPASKRIGLSCLPHLLNWRLPTAVPAMGQTFDQAVIARVDQGLGLLLRLPTEPESAVGFCHVSNLADGQLGKGEIEKRFKVGGLVRGRVIGFRLVDALVAMSLKESVLAQQVYSVKDLYPGQHLDVTVLDATSAGLVVQITPNLKGLVPKTHMSDAGVLAEGSKLPSKLKPGKTLVARVLSVDPVAKRVQLTLKKGLLGSKLPVLSDLRQAAPGMKLHGVVTGVQGFGVFVGFYGGVSGLLPKAHLDLLPGQTPADLYSVGQLLRCQVASVDLRKGGLVLKPSSKKAAEEEAAAAAAEGAAAAAAGDPWGGLAVGSLLQQGAVVQQVLLRPAEQGGGLVELTVTGANGQPVLAHLPASHLSDHPGGAEGLLGVLKPGLTLPGPLLVLQQRRVNPNTQGLAGDRWQGGKDGSGAAEQQQQQQQQRKGDGVPMLLLSRKASLVAAAAAGGLPESVAQVAAGAVLPGYVASVTRDAVFVRFLGRCTGRAGLPQLSDTFVTDPARHFSVGQSVVAAVVAVEGSGGGEGSAAAGVAAVKFAVSLKPSVVGSHEGQFLASLMSDLELAYTLQQQQAAAEEADGGSGSGAEEEAATAAAADWVALTPGRTVAGKLHELRGYGAVIDVEGYPDVVGLVTPDHGGIADLQGTGSLDLCILDVVKTSGLVELSKLPALLNMQQPAAAAAAAAGSSKKASKRAAAAADAQQQQLAVGQEVQAMVQFIKDHYVVVSIVQQQQQQQQKKAKKDSADATKQQQQQQQYSHHGIAFVARGDFNSQGAAGREARRFAHNQVVAAKVAGLQSAGNGGRLLLELNQPLLPGKGAKGGAAAGTAAAAAGGGSKPAAGAVVAATVVAVHELELEMAVGKAAATAHLHVSELQERLTALPSAPNGNPLSSFKLQQQLTVAWLGHVRGLGHKRGKEPQLSMRPSVLAAAKQQQGAGKAKLAPVLTAADLHPGLKVVGWLAGFTKDALWLSLAPELKGRVHLLESADSPEALAAGFEARFSMGQGLVAVVLGVDAKQHTLDLSLRGDRLRRGISDPAAAAGAAAAAAADRLAGGALVPGRIVSVTGSGVVVQLGPKTLGVVAVTDIHDSWVPNALAGLSAGVYVRARVLAAEGAEPRSGGAAAAAVDSKGRVLLSLRPSEGGQLAAEEGTAEAAALAAASKQRQQQGAAAAAGLLLQPDQLTVGSKVQGYVRSVSTKGLFVTLDRIRDARVKLSQLSDGFVEDPAAAFPVGSRVEGRVVSVEHTKPPPAAAAAAAAAAVDDGVRVELSLRSGDGPGQLRTLADIKEGELTTGKVRRVERYGVFVELSRSRVSGLVHVSKTGLPGHVKEKDLAAAFSPGQAVRVRVLAVDAEAGKVTLSMQPELLVGSDDEDDDAGNEQQQAKKRGKAAADFDEEMVDALEAEEDEGEDEESEEGSEGSMGLDDMDASEDDDDEDEDEDEDDDDSEQQLGSEDEAAGSSDDDDDASEGETDDNESDDEAAAAADWGELQLQDAADASGAAAAAAANGGAELSRGEKKRLKAAKEAELRAAERARLAGDAAPESAAGYEQQLLSEPNSSFLWVKYMAFQLKLGEIDAARQVAERALKTIAMTSERDKFNVWVALMNLENAYGGANAEDALMAVFKRAVGYCEPKPLYLALLGILERSGRHALAGEVWRTATKKFNTSCKVWLGAYESVLQAAARAAAEDAAQPGSTAAAAAAAAADGGGAARQVLERALKSLPKRKHVKALLRAALAEFRGGCAERGRSVLEGLLANYPKRTDIWNVYIDQEVKGGDAPRTRALLARATSLGLPPKKMKVLFRRWLEFEQQHGSSADVAAVKQRAVEYMESQALRNN
uniref:S1 motif domain-containing protein n=1 Tax=Tetradesmus obliquus TaxID=3088 RepID=A0A383V4G5_TETOB|eukprot:jgi/Sobl393_1/8105/SZX59981.1